MTNCPFCLEEIKGGARKCPHCQSSLEPAPESADATVYVVDKGLLRFTKFVAAILGIFILVGIYLFGFDIKDAGRKTSEASIEVQKALLEIERQKGILGGKLEEINKSILHIEALEREVVAHRDEVKQLVSDIRRHRDEATQLVVELRTLKPGEASVALAKRVEIGIEPSRGKLWKNGSTLKFRFLDGEDGDRTIVRLAIRQWAEHVNLTFEEVPSGEAELRISFAQPGSWSFIGTDALGIPNDEPTINYGVMKLLEGEVAKVQSALHEFGHALGLAHEFQSPHAGRVFDEAAVLAFYSAAPFSWDEKTIRLNVLGKVEYPGSRAYDPTSIMNYAFPRHLFLPGKETAPGNGLSESDKAYVASLYPKDS